MVRLNKLSRMRGEKDYYQCPRCGFVLPKKDAIISAWDSEGSLRHVHRLRCGKIITHTP